jgi:hypothetical protein
MSAIERIAYNLGRRDEVPNQELARELAEARDATGIAEIAEHLRDRNKSVASDCLKVLYEVGYADPTLIEPYTGAFIELLGDRNNRMVWGGMIALATLAEAQHDVLWEHVDDLVAAVQQGSVITRVWGVKALAVVASKDPGREESLRPFMMGILRECPPKLVATHAEGMLPMVHDGNSSELIGTLESRRDELSRSQSTRLDRVLRGMP